MARTAPPGSSVRRRVASASIWVTGGMLAGRFAGIAREFLLAKVFGVARETDLAILLIVWPDLIVALVGTGAVNLVLIPILLDHDVAVQLQLIRRLTIRVAALAAGLGVVAAGVSIAVGTDWATESDVSVQAFRTAVIISMLALPSSFVVALTASYLQAQNRFAIVSFSTVLFTLPILVAIVTLRSVVGIAIGIAAGGLLRYGVQLLAIGRRPRTATTGSVTDTDVDLDLRGIVRGKDFALASATSFLAAMLFAMPLLIAAILGAEGDVALVNYGWKLLVIPTGLLTGLFSVAAYPLIVRSLRTDGSSSPRRTPSGIVRPVVFLALMTGIWLVFNATSVADVVYGAAGLADDSLGEIAAEIRIGAAAIPVIIIGRSAGTMLFALKKTIEALLPSLIGFPVFAVLGAVFFDRDGPRGIMYGLLGYAVVMCTGMLIVLHRTAGLHLLTLGELRAGAVFAAAMIGLALFLRQLFSTGSLSDVLLNGSLFVALSGSVFLLSERRSQRGGAGAAET